MDKTQQNLFRNDNLRARRTPSKVVSDAFGFLNNKTYSDRDGLVRIHSSYSETSLAHIDHRNKPSDWLQQDVYIPDDTEEFTIVTSVEKSPQPKHRTKTDEIDGKSTFLDDSPTNHNHVGDKHAVRRDSLPSMYLADTPMDMSAGSGNPTIQTNGNDIPVNEKIDGKDEFIIVDYLEDYNKRRDTGTSVVVGNNDSQTITDNLDRHSGTKNNKENSNLHVNAIEVSDDRTGDNEPRKSVNIGDDVVELRSPNRDARPARAPTWKQNQIIVSEAFNFLQDLEGGDTVSVINVPIEDRSETESHINIDSTHDNKVNKAVSGKVDTGLSNGIPNIPNKTTANLNSFGKSTNLNSFGKPVSASFENRASSDLDSDPNSPDRFSVSSERDDRLGELGVSRLRQRRKSPRKDSDDDDDGDSSDEDRGD